MSQAAAHFDPQGREDWRQVTYDDGSRDWLDYEQEGNQSIRQYQAHFDGQGREDWRNATYDDGHRDWTDYDQSGTKSWSRVESRFDTQGREDNADMFMDNGTRDAYDYDQDNSHGWNRVVSSYNVLGLQDYANRYFDDNSRLFIDYDFYAPGQDKLQTYDALGRTTFTGSLVKGVVVGVSGQWNPAFGEGMGVVAVAPGFNGVNQRPTFSPDPWVAPYDPYPNAQVIVGPLGGW